MILLNVPKIWWRSNWNPPSTANPWKKSSDSTKLNSLTRWLNYSSQHSKIHHQEGRCWKKEPLLSEHLSYYCYISLYSRFMIIRYIETAGRDRGLRSVVCRYSPKMCMGFAKIVYGLYGRVVKCIEFKFWWLSHRSMGSVMALVALSKILIYNCFSSPRELRKI